MSEDDKALVKRLRLGDFYRDDAAYWEVDAGKADALCDQAADRIEQLTAEVERLQSILADMNDSDIIANTMAENERLREALSKVAAECWVTAGTDAQMYSRWRKLAVERVDIARAALEGKQ